METKECSVCMKVKSLDLFYSQKRKNKSKGEYIYYNPECKECTKSRAWKWQKENWDKMTIHFKKENAKPEKKQRHRELYWKRKEEGYYQQYYESNKEKFKEYNSDRRKKNHQITDDEWDACKTYFNNSCAYCEYPLDLHRKHHNQDLHREHVDPDGKDDLSNCVPSCRICNVRKKLKSLKDWYNSQNENFDAVRLTRIMNWLREDYMKYIKL